MTSESESELPLSGIRVIDTATVIAGPYYASILGEFGADVIKVEHPLGGDPLRRFGTPTARGDTLTWLSEARNKRSVNFRPARRSRGRTIQETDREIGHPVRELSSRNARKLGPGLGKLAGNVSLTGCRRNMAYTFSKSFDQASSFEGELNPLDPRGTYSLSQFDARHRLVSATCGNCRFRSIQALPARCSAIGIFRGSTLTSRDSPFASLPPPTMN